MNPMNKRKNRSLYPFEIVACKHYILTDHAKQRLSERMDFTQLRLRIIHSKHAFFDYDGKIHLFLKKENCELIGRFERGSVFVIYTVLVVSLSGFIQRQKMFVDY